MNWIVKTLQNAPELAIFFTLALGFVLGRIKIKGFALGTVTGVLLAGVLVGQLDIAIPATVKSAFFLLFLFAIGYSVGPQFVRGLRKEGLPQILFAVVVCVLILGVTWAAARIAGFDAGNAAGLLAGANTISGAIGVAQDTINQLDIDAARKSAMIGEIPVAYAVTYIFGTVGTAWFLGIVGPRLLGGDIIKQSREYEVAHGGSIHDDDPTLEYAYNGTTFRVMEVSDKYFDTPKTIGSVEEMLLAKGEPVYIERLRLRSGDIIKCPTPDQQIMNGDRIVLNGPIEALLKDENFIGSEVADVELMDFRVEVLHVLVSNKSALGSTLGELRTQKQRHGVVIRRLRRGNTQIPLLRNVRLERGDVIEIEGRRNDADRFAAWLGYAERPTNATDLLYVAVGVFLGGLLGSLTVHAGNIPLSLSASGGVLIVGIVFGWLRSVRPRFGHIPEPAVWLMNNLGLSVFIAAIGISAGPTFIAALKTSGVSLFVAGVFVSILPVFFGLLIGKYIFKFHPAINLGANAGSRTTTAALASVTEASKSQVAALSYTATYAVGNTLLIIWGVVIVLLMS